MKGEERKNREIEELRKVNNNVKRNGRWNLELWNRNKKVEKE